MESSSPTIPPAAPLDDIEPKTPSKMLYKDALTATIAGIRAEKDGFPPLSTGSTCQATSSASNRHPTNLEYALMLKIIKLKIIPPFTKENFLNLQGSFKSCASAIMAKFPPGINTKITISKIFTKIKDKNLHTILVTAPIDAEPYIREIQTKGIELLGKTVFPLGARPQNENKIVRKSYPKAVKVKFVNLPLQCDPDEILREADMPHQAQVLDYPERETENTEHGQFFTGRACVTVSVPNKETEDELRIWSKERRLGGPLEWEDIPISFHIPSLHHCSYCNSKGKFAMGHQSEWCFERIREERATIAKKVQHEDEEDSQSEEEVSDTDFESVVETEGESEGEPTEDNSTERTNIEKPEGEEKFKKVKAKKRKKNKSKERKLKKSKQSTSPRKNGAN
ncbi:MAG: hypothetical protein AAF757_30080 [Cyanobacteria bacterium P01_D01_bin.116]